MAASETSPHVDGIQASSSTADSSYPNVKLRRVAFGSCHSREAVNKRLLSKANSTATVTDAETIWDVISSAVQPQTFLWTGDAIYAQKKTKGDTPLSVMQNEYQQMLHNETLGYARFLHRDDVLVGGVHGTWDDHDYGGNDRGRELKEREERRDLYLDFLDVPKDSTRRQRNGVYGSVEFGKDTSVASESASQGGNSKVKVIFLDTRWHRSRHCIPSVGANPYLPYGAIVACVTRLITAGLDLPSILPSWTSCSNDANILGEDQWTWLEQELEESNASMHVIISSIQVLTTNPVVESWGHFPMERERLIKLLNNVPGLVILSGDVHHAEISTTKQRNNQFDDQTKNEMIGSKAVNKGAIVEITSSGLTHSCDEPFYGPLCQPILDTFPAHRFASGDGKDDKRPSYFTSKNFGSIDIDWISRSYKVHIHDNAGDIVLSTGSFDMDTVAGLSNKHMSTVAKCIDGRFLLLMREMAPFCIMGLVLVSLCFFYYLRSIPLRQNINAIKYKRA